MTRCFKCGKILPGDMRPGEYVMCRECEAVWRGTETAVNKVMVEQMRKKVMELKPFGWIFTPRQKDMMTIEIDRKEIVLCRECKHYFKDDNGHVVVMRCELNHECMKDDFFCADGEKEGEDNEPDDLPD